MAQESIHELAVFLRSVGDFPLQRLQDRYKKIRFTDTEALTVQMLHKIFWIVHSEHRKKLPPAFVGTPLEVWGLIQTYQTPALFLRVGEVEEQLRLQEDMIIIPKKDVLTASIIESTMRSITDKIINKNLEHKMANEDLLIDIRRFMGCDLETQDYICEYLKTKMNTPRPTIIEYPHIIQTKANAFLDANNSIYANIFVKDLMMINNGGGGGGNNETLFYLDETEAISIQLNYAQIICDAILFAEEKCETVKMPELVEITPMEIWLVSWWCYYFVRNVDRPGPKDSKIQAMLPIIIHMIYCPMDIPTLHQVNIADESVLRKISRGLFYDKYVATVFKRGVLSKKGDDPQNKIKGLPPDLVDYISHLTLSSGPAR